MLSAATVACSLAADVRTDIVGQVVLSVGVWTVLFYLLDRAERDLRIGLMTCLVIATCGEIFLSLIWGLYTYRLANIPLFVPPAHVLLLILGISLARFMREAIARAIIVCSGIYAVAAAVAGVDTFALPLFLLLGLVSWAMPNQRRLYASTFVLSLALELYGTWLGNWTWVREVPGIAVVTTNPPGVASAFYCALDALVGAASMLVTPRAIARATRSNADSFPV